MILKELDVIEEICFFGIPKCILKHDIFTHFQSYRNVPFNINRWSNKSKFIVSWNYKNLTSKSDHCAGV